MIKVSFNITTRNDSYYNDNLRRLSKTINTNLFFLDKIGMRSSVEFNIVDWGSIDPLYRNVQIYEEYKNNFKDAVDTIEKLSQENSDLKMTIERERQLHKLEIEQIKIK